MIAAPALAGLAPAELDVSAATAAYFATLSPDEMARSDAYFEGGYWLQLWTFLYGATVYWLVLRLGLAAKIRDRTKRITAKRSLQVGLFFLALLLIVTLATAPLAVYASFFREHQYGLSNQSFGEWAGDRAKGLAIGGILGGLVVMLIYAAIRRAGHKWWLWGAGVGVGFVLLGLAVAPVYIAPLFNEYTVLEDGPVKSSVLRMARQNGIAVTDIYKSDASRQSNRISANVSGLLGTERITLNDNLLSRCSQAEIEAVMGHEMGHYVLGHAYKGVLFFGLVLVLGFAFVAAGFERLTRRFGERWGVEGVSDPAGMPVLAVLFSIYAFVLTPITNSYTRAMEYEADLYGLNAARQPEGFAEVALKLGEYRKLNPGHLEEILFFDHPSGRVRIETAMRWKAAEHQR